jgi:hypothetical protein
MRMGQRASIIRMRTVLAPTGGCCAALTLKVKVLPEKVNAEAQRDTDKGRVIAR